MIHILPKLINRRVKKLCMSPRWRVTTLPPTQACLQSPCTELLCWFVAGVSHWRHVRSEPRCSEGPWAPASHSQPSLQFQHSDLSGSWAHLEEGKKPNSFSCTERYRAVCVRLTQMQCLCSDSEVSAALKISLLWFVLCKPRLLVESLVQFSCVYIISLRL